MYRRILILRRFDALSFGLGYFEDGAWIDHTTLPDRGLGLAIAGVTTPAERSAIHAMLECCTMEGDQQGAPMTTIPIRSTSRQPTAVLQAHESDVDAVVGRSTAV